MQLNTFWTGNLQTAVRTVLFVNGMRATVPVGSGDVRATVVRHDFMCCVLGDYVVMQMFFYFSPQHC